MEPQETTTEILAFHGELARRLIEMKEADDRAQAVIDQSGLAEGEYHPELEALHLANARELESIIEAHGWPGRHLVGEDAAAAAFQIVLHAISYPPFQLWCLELLETAVQLNRALPKQFAILFDRIRFNQRLPQRYGTILDWDENGTLRPWKLESPDGIDELRASVGLEPLGIYAARMRFNAEIDGERSPSDCKAYLERIQAWAHDVGWIY